MRIEQAQVVKGRREQVFQIWTDYESWPRFSVLFTRVTVTERVGNTVHLDTDIKIRHGHMVGIDHRRGRKARRTEKHVLTPSDQVQVEGETEGATNSSAWKFESVPEGTLVTAVVEGPLAGLTKVFGPYVRRQLQTLLREELRAFARYVEAR